MLCQNIEIWSYQAKMGITFPPMTSRVPGVNDRASLIKCRLGLGFHLPPDKFVTSKPVREPHLISILHICQVVGSTDNRFDR